MSGLPLDYETLRLIWWALLGILLIGFAIMGGMDLGIGTLLPFVARTDEERRVLLNLSGPTWEGNQVWLVLGGGAIFAAWPAIYAASFSGFYLAMIAILLALILRPVGFKFRGKVDDPRWRNVWDWGLFVGGFVPSLVFGVAVGNLFLGVPFRLDDIIERACQLLLVVRIELEEPQLWLHGLSNTLVLWRHVATRPAPGRPDVDHHGQRPLMHLPLQRLPTDVCWPAIKQPGAAAAALAVDGVHAIGQPVHYPAGQADHTIFAHAFALRVAPF